MCPTSNGPGPITPPDYWQPHMQVTGTWISNTGRAESPKVGVVHIFSSRSGRSASQLRVRASGKHLCQSTAKIPDSPKHPRGQTTPRKHRQLQRWRDSSSSSGRHVSPFCMLRLNFLPPGPRARRFFRQPRSESRLSIPVGPATAESRRASFEPQNSRRRQGQSLDSAAKRASAGCVLGRLSATSRPWSRCFLFSSPRSR